MADEHNKLPSRTSSSAEIDAFLRKVALTPSVKAPGQGGRLLFAIDATASRERGFREMKATAWLDSGDALIARMVKVRCLAGRTQIRKVLRHALSETAKRKVDALVFIGDVVEEDVDALGELAG